MRQALVASLATAFLLAGCGGPRQSADMCVPLPAEIFGVELNLGNPSSAIETLDPRSQKDRAIIDRLLRLLRQARHQENVPPGPVAQFGDHVLLFVLGGGKTLAISQDWLPADRSAGNGVSPRYVLVSRSDGQQARRCSDPAMARWLSTGWRRDLPLTASLPQRSIALLPGAVLPAVRHPVPDYAVGDCWFNASQLLCSGYPDALPSQGVVIAYSEETFRTVGIFTARRGDGPLRLASFAGNRAVLRAEDGATYVFQLGDDHLARQ